MAKSGLSSAEVMDLVPVRPLAEDEPSVRMAYRTRLRAVFDRIRPAAATA
jgi:pyrroline-5-carboxylate reductase